MRSPLAALLAGAILVTASGCTRETDFDIHQSFTVRSSTTSFQGVESVNLAEQAGSAWKHRDNVKHVRVQSAEAVITAVNPANAATVASGSASFRPDGAPADGSQDELVGAFADAPVEVGTTLSLDGASPGLNGAIDAALDGSGVMTFLVSGTADAPVDVVLDATVRVTVEYSLF